MPSSKRTAKSPVRFRAGGGKSGKRVITNQTNKASGSAKRKRQTSILVGGQDAMADAAAGAMSMDERAAPGSRKKPEDKSRKIACDEAETDGLEEDGEEEVEGEGEEVRADDDGDSGGSESCKDDDGESGGSESDDDSESGGSESSKDGSGSGSDTSGAELEAELAGARKLLAASSAQRPKVADKEGKKGDQGKKAVVEGAKEGQGNKIRQEKPVKESQQGKKHKPQQNPTVMIVIICDKSQSDR